MFSFNSVTKRRLAWLISLLVWTQVVAASAWWSISSMSLQAEQMAAQRGRDLFRMIELTRQWISPTVDVGFRLTDQHDPLVERRRRLPAQTLIVAKDYRTKPPRSGLPA